MDDNLDSLEDFAKQFAGNWRSFLGYIWTRTDIPDTENWGIIYIQNNQLTPVDIVNAEHLKYLLWVYLHHKSKKRKQKHIYQIRDRHFAAGLTEGFLVCIFNNGTVTNACAALYDYLSALRKYPVSDDEAFDKLEAEMFADAWPDILKMIVAEFDGDHSPFNDDGYRYFVNLKKMQNTEGISALFLKHNLRAYWSSDTGCFRLQCFLYGITDGRISFDDVFFACPENEFLNFSAVLATLA